MDHPASIKALGLFNERFPDESASVFSVPDVENGQNSGPDGSGPVAVQSDLPYRLSEMTKTDSLASGALVGIPKMVADASKGAAAKKRVQGGVATTDVVLSAHQADNSEVFPQVLALHVPEGSVVADLTYGRGVFWKRVREDAYTLLKSDLKLGQCWSTLPYDDASVDAVVFDPPYMEGLYRRSADALAGNGTHSEFQKAYSNGKLHNSTARKYHDAVLEAYLSVVPQVKRILVEGGTFIVKCQDEVSANRQKLTHVELIWALEHHGFYCKDIFVVVRRNVPVVSRLVKQEHARKNHSYFLVFVRQDDRPRLAYSNFSPWLRDDIG